MSGLVLNYHKGHIGLFSHVVYKTLDGFEPSGKSTYAYNGKGVYMLDLPCALVTIPYNK